MDHGLLLARGHELQSIYTEQIRSHLAHPRDEASRGDSHKKYHVRAYQGSDEVFSIGADGSGTFYGGLVAGNGTFSVGVSAVGAGWAQAANIEVSDSLQVRGSVSVEDSFTIGSGLALTSGGITVDVGKHTGGWIYTVWQYSVTSESNNAASDAD